VLQAQSELASVLSACQAVFLEQFQGWDLEEQCSRFIEAYTQLGKALVVLFFDILEQAPEATRLPITCQFIVRYVLFR
jgi:hypothetical protein